MAQRLSMLPDGWFSAMLAVVTRLVGVAALGALGGMHGWGRRTSAAERFVRRERRLGNGDGAAHRRRRRWSGRPGWHLLAVDSCRPERQILFELARQVADPPSYSFWVGANDLEVEGEWRWTSGEIWGTIVPLGRMNRNNRVGVDCSRGSFPQGDVFITSRECQDTDQNFFTDRFVCER